MMPGYELTEMYRIRDMNPDAAGVVNVFISASGKVYTITTNRDQVWHRHATVEDAEQAARSLAAQGWLRVY